MGAGIFDIVTDLEETSYTTSEEFFMIFNKALINAKNKYQNSHFSGGYTYIPGVFKKVEKLISLKERENNGYLPNEKRREIITQYMDIGKYYNIKNFVNPLNLDHEYINDEGEEVALLDSQPLKNIFLPDIGFNNYNIAPECLCKAVEYVLDRTQTGKKRTEKAKMCAKALFTAHCIKEAPDNYLEKIKSVLDEIMLKEYRDNREKPILYKTYLAYHPERKKSSQNSVESSASQAINGFLNEVKAYLENNELLLTEIKCRE